MPDSNARNILLVEDDKDINRLIAYCLRREGFRVQQVYDGTEASRILEGGSFDIAILDIMLPGASGISLCRQIKNNVKSGSTFVMIVSAKNTAEDKILANILGADCYLTKPFNTGFLVRTIKELSSLRDKEFVVEVR